MGQDTSHNERFVRLFAANEAGIHRFIRNLVPSRDDASDVMQEVAVVLWRKFDSSMENANFRKWAIWVARYEVMSWRRKMARDRHIFNEELLMLLAEEAEELEGCLSAQRDALQDCLEKLSESQRKLLLAAYASRGGMQGVAQDSGRSLQGFYRWLYRIRMMLLACVQKKLQEEVA